jgi:hypothetical protein
MGRELTMRGGLSVGSSGERRSWIALGISVLLLVAGAWLALAHVLVNLSNSREGHSIVPGTIVPGGSVSGEVTLANRGWLPISITLQPDNPGRSLPSGISVKIEERPGSILYVGPLQKSMGPLLLLQPGREAHILMTVASDDPRGTAAIPLPLTYYWAAVPALPWWWWIPILLIVAGPLYYGFRRARGERP